MSQVVMFHVSTLSEDGIALPKALVGRHVRLSVSEYQTAETGHHHSRIVLWYNGVEDLGVASRKSLRATWVAVKGDLHGARYLQAQRSVESCSTVRNGRELGVFE